jgi:protein-arginine kinase activator protein McsA
VERRNREINEHELRLLRQLDDHVSTSRQLHELTLSLLKRVENQEYEELRELRKIPTQTTEHVQRDNE